MTIKKYTMTVKEVKNMTIKDISDMVKLLSGMTDEEMKNLAFFAAGMLCGLTVLEPRYEDAENQ